MSAQATPLPLSAADDMNIPFGLFLWRIHKDDGGGYLITADCFQPRKGVIWRDGFRDHAPTRAAAKALIKQYVLPCYVGLRANALAAARREVKYG